MADETKPNEEFLGDLKDDATKDPFAPNTDDPFASLEEEKKETPAEPEVAAEPEEVEKPLPFNKDPKIQRYIDKRIAERLAEQPEIEYERPSNEPDKIDKVLTKIIGNDTPEKLDAIKELKEVLLEREDRGAEKAFERLQAEQQAEAQAEAQADEQLMQGFEAIEEENGVDITSNNPQARKLRVQFIDFIRKVAPKDQDGEIIDFPDLEQTFQVFQSTRQSTPSQTARAKDLATKSMARSEGTAIQQKPSERVSWDTVGEKIREKLGL